MSSPDARARRLWPLVSLFGAFVYLHSLGGLYIPHIGDEAPYVEIVRLTAESSSWLPLKTAPGLENTKPPLLFWLGILATEGGRAWSLLRLRLPIVFITFATAFVLFRVVRKRGYDRETAFLGSLTFLGFYSSFQYGRPFLTNSPETLFVFLSFAWVWLSRDRTGRIGPWIGSGIALGTACLFKSFALVVPVGLALFWLAAFERRFELPVVVRRDLPRVLLAVAIALACFALWPLLDPDPGAILRHFVLEENLGKLDGRGYLPGLFEGPYALHWLWLGHFGNAGLFAVPLAFLVIVSLRERKRLSRDEKALWILVLSFLLVYSLPSQRQENYLIPTVPALAMLLALRWKGFPAGWFRWFSVPGALFALAVLAIVLAVRSDVLPPGAYAGWQIAAFVVVLGAWISLLVRPATARFSFHALVLASFLLISLAVAPFEGPLGRFDPARVRALRGRKVFVPTEFISRHERHRFLLPGARIEGYDPADADRASRLLDSGRIVVVHRGLDEDLAGPFRTMARRYDLRTRQSRAEMLGILFGREMDLLVRHELIVRRYRRDRLIGEP